MKLLRIYVSLLNLPQRCQWILINNDREPVSGEGLLADLPKHAEQVQLVLPAAEVLITSAQLPKTAKNNTGSVLAYAIEEETVSEPDSNQVHWLGAARDAKNILSVIDKAGLMRWQKALAAVGIHDYEIYCETLMLPYGSGEWSLAWNGIEGFIRTGEFEGAATDRGDSDTAPLSLHLMLEEAKARNAEPDSIAIYTTTSGVTPDIKKWSHDLGVSVRAAGNWDWRSASLNTTTRLTRTEQRWRAFSGIALRLRPALWIIAAVLLIHASALVIDWSSLSNEKHKVRQRMESRFRDVFPDAVAVTDPSLQMRRKLSEMHDNMDQPDSGNFLYMIEPIASAIKELPKNTVHAMSYENGRVVIELTAISDQDTQKITDKLLTSGMSVEKSPVTTRATSDVTVLLTMRSL